MRISTQTAEWLLRADGELKKTVRVGGGVVTLLAACGLTMANDLPVTPPLDHCHAAYQRFHELPPTSIEAQIAWWRSQESSCLGTGLYEYFLGKLYLRAEQYEQAAEAFENGLELDSEYEKELQLGRGDIELHRGRYALAERLYRAVVNAYPDWWAGHHFLGLALWTQSKLEPAIASLNRANKLGPTADSYGLLAMAYYSLDEFEKSADALNRAYSLDNSIAAERDPMIAAIRSYTELGKFKVAIGLLTMLLKARPEMREDEEYLKAGFYLKQKMAAAGALVDRKE